MGEDECHRLLCVWDDVYANVGDEVARFIDGFEALESDVFSSLELDKVLDAI